MKNYLFSIIAVSILISIGSCKRNDDEPERQRRAISRLYVSTSDYQASSSGADLFNVWAVDEVNGDKLPGYDTFYKFTSAAKGGRMIHYSPFNGGIIFQGSMNPRADLDTAVHVMGVSKTGVLSNGRSLPNRIYDKVRGLYYAVVNDGQLSEDYLLFANASDTTQGTPANQPAVPNYTLFAVNRPRNTGNFSRPRYKMKLEHNPWGVLAVDNDLIISKSDENGGLVVYKDFLPRLLQNGDTTMTESGKYMLTITGTNNIRGIAYSKSADMLLVTDFTQEAESRIGRILIFDKFSQYKTAQNITPDRIVSGALTKLQEPVDVAIDGKEGGKYFFVADPTARRVFRFLVNDSGNVAPNDELSFEDRPPQSISLDSR